MTVIMSNIRSSTFRRQRTVTGAASVFTAKQQRSGLNDHRWMLNFEYAPMRGADAIAMLGALALIDEGATRFLAYDPDALAGSSTGITNGLVNGASQTGKTLATDGWGALNLICKAGDYVYAAMPEAGDAWHLFRSTADVTSDVSGQANIPLDAPMRYSPLNNAVVSFSYAAANSGAGIPFLLTDYTHEVDVNGFHYFTLEGVEYIR